MDYSSKVHFGFASGGRYHFQGFGEWVIDLDREGHCHIQHFVGKDLKWDKIYPLSSKEITNLWNMIEACKIDEIQITPRPGVPDEVSLTFSVIIDNKTIKKEIWFNDLSKFFPSLKQLVSLLKSIIEKYTKQKVII